MQNVAEWMWDVWEAGQFVGDNRPMTRATISKRVLESYGPYRTLLFDRVVAEYEIPNIISVDVDRRLGADAAQMSMTIANAQSATPQENLDEGYTDSGPTKRELKEFGSPGYYSFGRGLVVGADGVSNPWGHDVDPVWVNMLAPNRVIKTFQGYGTDGAGRPSDDTRLVLTGVWLIDKVEFSSDGSVSIQCRDMAKLMIEQRLYPPIIPLDEYPLEFVVDHYELPDADPIVDPNPEEPPDPIVGVNVARHPDDGELNPNWGSSHGPVYNAWNPPVAHRAWHAFSEDLSLYWLSVGHSTSASADSFEWITSVCDGEPVNTVYLRTLGSHEVYVSVMVDGVWQGADSIPYSAGSTVDNSADIPYVRKFLIPSRTVDFVHDLDLGGTYNADQVRLTFGRLRWYASGDYRARVYKFEVRHLTRYFYVPPPPDTPNTREVLVPGNITDYTDIVKLFAAWSGFTWPWSTTSDPLLEGWGDTSSSPGEVRAWGDFMYSGAFPTDPPTIEPSYWDNKSVMDGINQIKEILGFVMYVDHTGGIVWRPPNIWRTGNYLSGVGYVDESSVRLVDEDKVLFDFGVTIDDQNLRSEIIAVAKEDPSIYGAFAPGIGPGETVDVNGDGVADEAGLVSDSALLAGQERIMLVADYPFGQGAEEPTYEERARAELAKFAYLTSLWIHWSVRTTKFRIPGIAALQPDDQIRIYERSTSESFIHYVQGVRSSMNLETGTWYMDIDTHWLGNGPDSQWMVSYLDMPPALAAYLRAIEQIPDDEDDMGNLPPGFFDHPLPYVPEDPPRVEDDYSHLFDLPPTPEWPPINLDWENDNPDFLVDPDYPAGVGGTAYNASNKFMYAYWGPRCSSRITYRFLSKWRSVYASLPPSDVPDNTHPNQTSDVFIVIDRRAKEAFAALAEIICEKQLNITQAGAQNCRRVKRVDCTWGNTWSNHAWGTALDLNWNTYPHGTKINSGLMYQVGIEAVDRIRATKNGARVFQWGNWWSTPDPMHFQVGCKATDLSQGVTLSG